MNIDKLPELFKKTVKVGLPLLAVGYSLIPSPAIADSELVDNGQFPQCREVNYMPRENLNREPLVDYPEPFHPQVKHLIETLYNNSIYDLVDVQLLPNNTEILFRATPGSMYCLADQLTGFSRFFVQTGEGAGAGIPMGWGSNGEQGTVRVTIPEGRNALLVTRMGERFAGSGKVTYNWLVYNLYPDETITFVNSDGSYSITGFGPVALPISWDNPGGQTPTVVAELVLPENPQW